MARWVRRMQQIDGWENQCDAWFKTLAPQPSEYRIRRLALTLHRHHIVIGRGMHHLLSEYDERHYATSVRNQMIATYDR